MEAERGLLLAGEWGWSQVTVEHVQELERCHFATLL